MTISIHILCGFLGSGKTTLLSRLLEYNKALGLKPAVLMNEIGEVNLDGIIIGKDVPMTELLGGCICCTVRGDLSTAILELLEQHSPDVIFIESTGIANPMEILEAVTDVSLLGDVALRSVTTVADASHLLEQADKGKGGRTFRLMQEQVRCANYLILNKTDLVGPKQLERLRLLLREWNRYAAIYETIKCGLDSDLLDQIAGKSEMDRTAYQEKGAYSKDGTEEEAGGCGCEKVHVHSAACSSGHSRDSNEHGHEPHHSHSHVMAYTHYFHKAVDSSEFEDFLRRLPQEVYRAKGIIRFTDTASPFVFQFAYREVEFTKVDPHKELPFVAVFIGENFEKEAVSSSLLKLENSGSPVEE